MKAVDVATQNPDALPGPHSVQDVQNIADVFRGMTAIRLALQQLYRQVDDTTTKVGSEAYAIAPYDLRRHEEPRRGSAFGDGREQSRPALRAKAEGR